MHNIARAQSSGMRCVLIQDSKKSWPQHVQRLFKQYLTLTHQSYTAHLFFFFGLGLGGAALVPRMSSKVLLGSLLDAGLNIGEAAVGGATPGGRGSASRPRFITLSRRRSPPGLLERDRPPAVDGSSRPGGGGSGVALAFSSCIAAFSRLSLAAHCCARFQQCDLLKTPSTPCSTISVGRLTT